MFEDRVPLEGSHRQPMPNAVVAGVPDANGLVSVTVILRRRTPELPKPGSARVTHEEFAAHYGANPADLPAVEKFAADNDLTMVDVSLERRSVTLSGTVADVNWAFGTELKLFQTAAGIVRGRTGELMIPASVAPVIEGVFGLDERPQARTRLRSSMCTARARAAGDTSYTPNAVAALYNFPSGGGAGQTVGIIELGGGYKSSDLSVYFGKIGVSPAPTVVSVGVDGGANAPAGDPNSADGEVLLDIEVVGAIAPKAKIAVYFAPNTDQGFLDAITTAIHDQVRKPSVISISWGASESEWTGQSLKNFDQAFQDAALLGVSICVASGDDGSSDNETDGAPHVDFPSSSPNVLACGGTRLESAKGKVSREVVWNEGVGKGAGGGGVSETFPLPSYQAKAGVPVSAGTSHFKGRGVPDVAGDADPATGYQIYVDGKSAVFGGTSAVAPLWAALIAILNGQRKKALGFANPTLYKLLGTKAFTDIVTGNNGVYAAKPGWDACTGLGTPNGQQLLTQLGSAKKAKKT